MNKIIVFLGVDGSGKSTVINQLNKKIHFKYYHFCPNRLYNNGGFSNPVTNPHSKKNYSFIVSLIKLIYLIAIFNYSMLKIKISRKCVIIDRFFYDIFIDPKRYRIKITKKILHLAQVLIIKPDIVFFCVGDAEIIKRRKDELHIDEIKQQQARLCELSKSFDNWIKIPTTEKSVQELVQLVEKSIC